MDATKNLIFDKLNHLQLKIKKSKLTQTELNRIYQWICDADKHLETYFNVMEVKQRK